MIHPNLEKNTKERFETAGRFENGQIESLCARIDKLESAVAHLVSFIAEKSHLTPEEVDGENGLIDF